MKLYPVNPKMPCFAKNGKHIVKQLDMQSTIRDQQSKQIKMVKSLTILMRNQWCNSWGPVGGVREPP